MVTIKKKEATVSLVSAFFIALASFVINDVIMLTKYYAFFAVFLFTFIFAYAGMSRGK